MAGVGYHHKALIDMGGFTEKVRFGGRFVIVGFGSIGQGLLPILLRHISVSPDCVHILSRDASGVTVAQEFGISMTVVEVTPDTIDGILSPLLQQGDFLLNLAVGVSSVALIEWCQARDVLYLDTSLEPWSTSLSTSWLEIAASKYELRESLLELRRRHPKSPTALTGHGANPGLVGHFVKQALLNIARDTSEYGFSTEIRSRSEWSALAKSLGIKTIQITEQDSQVPHQRKEANEFVNTWSVDAFIDEFRQRAELGWGTHERQLPFSGVRHSFGCRSSIVLEQSGLATRIKSWTPSAGATEAFLVSHDEVIAISDYLTIGGCENPEYRPTVQFAYSPCGDATHSIRELARRNRIRPEMKRILISGIVSGTEELGVLLAGNERGVYWYGARLTISQAMNLAPHNNGTTLQVAAAIVGGVVWAIENPTAGIVEPSEIDFKRPMEIAMPYLGEVFGAYSTWTPVNLNKDSPIPDCGSADQWQFQNFCIS